MRFWSISLLCLSLTACSWSNFPFLYKPNIQQGNEINQANVAQLKVGMSKDDVTYLMGTPVLVNILSGDETQYIYTYKPGKSNDMTQNQKVLLTFDKDKLTKIEK